MAPFCSCPASLVSRKFFAVGPGCAKCFFFLLRSVGRRDLSAGPEQKKNTTQGVFFFCSGPGERQGKEKPRWKPARGQSKKKHHPGCFFFLIFFFCSGPVPAPNGASSSPAFPRGRSKKKNPGCLFFFALAPCRLPTVLLLPLPFAGAAAKKKHPGWCFFFALAPCRLPTGLLLPLPFAGAAAKKHPGWCFFFAAAPRGRSLTHCGPGWRCLPLAGAVFFFLLRPRPDRGGVFFLLWPRPDAHSLTVGWGDFGKARVVFVFLLRPRRVFLDNSKKCLGYYIGSKKTWRGHSFPCLSPGPEQKKKTPGVVFFFLALAPCRLPTGLLLPLPFAGAAAKKKTPWVVFFFFAAAPRGRSLTHCGPGWRCLPLAGAVFSFLLRRGGIFFFCCGPARTLTHSRWAGAISARPGWCFFFCCGPAGSF